MLAKQNQEDDLTSLQEAVKRLLQVEDNVQIQMEGNITLRALQDRNHS